MLAIEDRNDDIESMMFGPTSQVAVSITCAAIVIFGLGGNGLVIYSVLSYKEMRTKINILILSLALADCLSVLFVPFITMPFVFPLYPFGIIWCKINQYAIYVITYANVYTLVLMSLNRYLAVVHSIWSMPYRTMRNTCITAIVVWVVSVLGNIPTVMQFGVHQYKFQNQSRSTCTINPGGGKLFYGPFFAFAYLLPVILICIMYALMVGRLNRSAVPGTSQSSGRMRINKRATKMVVTVVIVYALCLLPVNILFLFQNFSSYQRNSVTFIIETVAYSLGVLTSCINPFIYAFMSSDFRGKFKSIVCFKMFSRNENVSSTERNQNSSNRETPFAS